MYVAMTQHARDPAFPNPLDAGDASARLTTLIHELSNILDGSLRSLQLALRTLRADGGAIAGAQAGSEEDLRLRLSTVEQSLLRMNDLVRRVASPALSAQTLAGGSLLEALQHATQVARATIQPDVHGQHVVIEDRLDPALAGVHAGEVYAVALNALRNALDAMSRRSDRAAPGHILMTVGYFAPGMLRIEVVDDGPGIDPALDPALALRPGVSTKPGSAGVGLALAARIVTGMRGRLALAPRAGGGAVFVAEFPEPRDWGSITLGGGSSAPEGHHA